MGSLGNIVIVAYLLIVLALIAVILLQRSEGGALGMGGGPSGFMTARGAGNLLTQATWGLATAFFICAIGLTIVGNMDRASRSIIDADAVGALAEPSTSQQPAAPAPGAPAQPQRTTPSLDDLEASLPAASQPAPAPAQ